MKTNFAILDAISEEVNNSVYRKGQRSLGFSSGSIGSGMAFDYQYFKKTMSSIDAIGGFDKELELKILAEKHLYRILETMSWRMMKKYKKPKCSDNQRRRWAFIARTLPLSRLGPGLEITLSRWQPRLF
ncbi:MAG: hypothetical protein U5L96_03395 [Owenweeksia sp.]|nr:hypothetical protein [Owenweeksia sp.]